MDKVWQVNPRMDEDLITHLLKSRQFDSPQAEADFFNPSLSQLTSALDFPEMELAVNRLCQAIEKQESMVVWGDFDADGVCSTAVLWETLHQLGANVLPYIPNRDKEGHGFNLSGLKELADRGVKLIVTVDHGVTAFDEIDQASQLGIEVIVTDHHEPLEAGNVNPDRIEVKQEASSNENKIAQEKPKTNYVFPAAVAIIHPFRLAKVQPLAGCGVAYFLAYAVWLRQRQVSSFKFLDKTEDKRDSGERSTPIESGSTKNKELIAVDDLAAREEFAKDRIELVALGTIADLMPLTGDNRVFATEGLKQLTQTKRLGLLAMYGAAGLTSEASLTVYEVGFVIGPRLNAPGRLADALESLRLLCTKDKARATQLAQDLDRLNKERQELLVTVSRQAQKVAAERPSQDAYVLADPNWPAGVCGLAAGRLVEQLYRPVVIMEEQGELSRGSARSIKGFDITAALASIADLLESYGGHAMAAGFIAKTANLPEIEQRLSMMVTNQVPSEQLIPALRIEAEVGLSEMDWPVWDFLKTLEPCGMGNPQPVFVSYGAEVVDCKTVGADKKHLKLSLRDAQSARLPESDSHPRTLAPSPSMEAIAFGFGSKCDELLGQRVAVVFNLDENVWNGKRSLQLKIKDIRLAT